MRYLSEISWRHSRDFDTQFPNIFEFFYVCQSVSWLTFSLKLVKYMDISSFGGNILRHPWDVGTLVTENMKFLNFCQSVGLLLYCNMKIIDISPILD